MRLQSLEEVDMPAITLLSKEDIHTAHGGAVGEIALPKDASIRLREVLGTLKLGVVWRLYKIKVSLRLHFPRRRHCHDCIETYCQ